MDGPAHVVVVGGGVGGLAAALALGRDGHRVTLLDRDHLPATPDPEAAFTAERRGAPQVHQTHGFLARVVVEMRRLFPDVLDELRAVGCTTMPARANLGDPQPGDDDLAVLIVRRTTFEWVLRRAVVAEPGIELRTDVAVEGLAGAVAAGGPPRITGVRLHDGSTLDADVVVAATGRRGDVPGWLAPFGIDVHEEVRESGHMYLSRWYRLPVGWDEELPPKLGGDLGFVKYLAVPGDHRTLSVTLAIRSDDRELRAALSHADAFDLACRTLPGPDTFFVHPLEADGGVRPMGGLLNRIRRFTDAEGNPSVLGFHALGDAHTCTNPLYGRGCSLALAQASLLLDAMRAHPDDPLGRASAYEAACAEQVAPWYQVSVEMDAAGADPTGFGGGGKRNRGVAALFVAAETDPVIGRGLTRFWNLLSTPAELASDPELVMRMAAVMADPDAYPVPEETGPTRDELLSSLPVAQEV